VEYLERSLKQVFEILVEGIPQVGSRANLPDLLHLVLIFVLVLQTAHALEARLEGVEASGAAAVNLAERFQAISEAMSQQVRLLLRVGTMNSAERSYDSSV